MEKKLEKIIHDFLENSSSDIEELQLLKEFCNLYTANHVNLNIDPYSFKDYVIKSDTLNYVHDFLSSINEEYKDEFDYALKSKKIVFLQTKKKKKNEKLGEYEIVASYTMKDSFDLIHAFFDYWVRKNGVITKDYDYFVDTLSILAEFLFQDYLESLSLKSVELYYVKTNRFIYTNIFTVHMIVELKLIELYKKYGTFENKNPISELEQSNISKDNLLEQNYQIITNDILTMKQISLPYHKRYLYGILFACYFHQKILKDPKKISSFCYLINHSEEIGILEFMKAIGIQAKMKKGKLILSRAGYQELKQSYLIELEDSFKNVLKSR